MDRFETDLVANLPRLRASARRLTRGDLAFAEDLVQDTCANALRARAQFTPGTSMRAWLMTILRHRFLSVVQRHHVTAEIADERVELMPAAAVPQDGRLAMLAFEEAFHGLPAAQREVLVLAVIEGHSYEEIAARCHCEVGTVKSRVSRARAKLRHHLNEVPADAA